MRMPPIDVWISQLLALWPLLVTAGRSAAGWLLIAVGVAVTISPVPFGFMLVIAGAAILGQRDRGLRRARIAWRRALGRWAGVRQPLVGRLGRRALDVQRGVERQMRARRRR